MCLDEDNEVWDMAGEFDAIINQMTAAAFCKQLRIDNATELMAQTAAAGLFIANCAVLGGKA